MMTAAAAAVALFAASAASAATMDFQFDNANSSISVTNNSTGCPFGSCHASLSAGLLTPFSSLSLAQGQSATFDFALFTIGNGVGFGNASIDTTLAFTQPDAGPASTTGSGSYFHTDAFLWFPSTTTGSLTWADAIQHFTTSNGSTYTVQFNDLLGFKLGSSVIDTVTITADSIAAAVPEPSVWAMLIIGMGMIGAALRRKPMKTAAAAA